MLLGADPPVRLSRRAKAQLSVEQDEHSSLVHPVGSVIVREEKFIRLREDLTPEAWRGLTADATERLCYPVVNRKALEGLKFSEALPERLAEATLAARLADFEGAARVLAEPVRFVSIY